MVPPVYIDYSSNYIQGSVRYDPLVVSALTSHESIDLFTNNLYDVQDYFQLRKDNALYSALAEAYCDSVYLMAGIIYREGWGMTSGAGVYFYGGELFFSFSDIPEVYQFNYSVQEKVGEVNFGFRRMKFSGSYALNSFYSEIFYTVISPYDNGQKIHSEINGKEAGGYVSLKEKDSLFEGRCLYGKTTIDLYENISPFGKLKDGEYIFYSASGSELFNKYCTVEAGITGMNLKAGRKSYFEIWPFTFWDMFLPSRANMNSFDISLQLPFAGITGSYPVTIQNIKINPSCSTEYFHLILNDKIEYSKKIWDLYPFVAHYEKARYDISHSFYGILYLHADLISEIENIKLKFRISQLVPVKKIKMTDIKSDSENSNRKESGPFIDLSVTGYL